ncbi:hypothetical protein RJ641_009416 [Dillenia turbinata]|uniref:Uncharacterized protein n=1 Tax=Dillenia turbinata TaxID=194707 RepID=A0AAN8V031_9MAGN
MTTPESTESQTPRNPNPSPKTPQAPPSVIRLWRPAAQRNLRNQWSKLVALRNRWVSVSSSGRSHATSLVNAYLSQKYMPQMDLGVLKDMPKIREKACIKLAKQQVATVTQMANAAQSMRCFLKGASNSPVLQFSSSSENGNDNGDCGGTPVYLFWSISSFETLAQELVQMFAQELNLKRLLVMELLGISCEEDLGFDELSWSSELYAGEFDDLSICSLYSKETDEPVPPRVKELKSGAFAAKFSRQPDSDVLQVYLTIWLAEVNINTNRSGVEEEQCGAKDSGGQQRLEFTPDVIPLADDSLLDSPAKNAK